jgi:hypothetical protein
MSFGFSFLWAQKLFGSDWVERDVTLGATVTTLTDALGLHLGDPRASA